MSRNPSDYRPCVGAVILNRDGKVWLGRRYGVDGPYVWQFPQGGRDPGETSEIALWREMWEEIGLRPEHVELLDRTECELIYDYPPAVRAKKSHGKLGQRQVWFALRMNADNSVFRFDNEDPPEFTEWRWADFHEAVDGIIPFKRKVYEAVAGRFLHLSDLHK